MQRYFLKNLINSDHITLTKDQDVFKHFGKVLRARVGSQAEFVSVDLKVVIGEVIAIDETKITLAVKSRLDSDVELPLNITIIVSPLKNDRSDWLVQKATELGVNRIVFAEMTRTVADWKKQEAKKAVRLQKIAQSAAEQSHRLLVPQIQFLTWQNVLDLPKQMGLVAWEESARTGEVATLVKSINEVPIDTDVSLVFGPEGGLTILEIEALARHEYYPAGLGPRILRAETAPLYALSAISVLRELNE
ncbi:16S rRNA (uracil(1498)-N(3))-methyltransferase [Leuconostoc gelidum subsp. aenigmaticum]|uniref:RsmE family RNA methyltransferase n=1 Tax=Leuconostoc gelidum TaxID=1244 RepID=UPI001CC38CB1|nr:RsmE family RNA methyltransferase [Leuconostoc gelidum]MBZ6002881.1 16S rRNA (uracil(1498)-N(3))-methyltransferase [Leuconostoc gelidum subsp. aenigmaticum]